ncbi:MAG: thiamine-phosphate kinase [Thermoanaerobaculia bacterium]|nr:thiamine-phosphate kinase [Thermoanaerobaculia bacterium]
MRLRDLGERELSRTLLAERYASVPYFGNDVAVVPTRLRPDEVLVATTDPCPPPVAFELGFRDYYYLGWLLGAINFSDLAAAGARPLCILPSIVMPGESEVHTLSRLLDGLDACSATVGALVVGGNLKEGPAIDATATAIGAARSRELVTRTGARAGQLVVLIGNTGHFWAAVLLKRMGIEPDDRLLSAVLTPRPKVAAGTAFARERLLSACIDNSDGLQPSLQLLAEASSVGFRLDLDTVEFSRPVRAAAAQLGVPPLRLALGWGDWQLVGTCERDDLERVRAVCDEEVHVLGVVEPGNEVLAMVGGQLGRLGRFESERFAADSWFTAGLGSYIERILTGPLLQ